MPDGDSPQPQPQPKPWYDGVAGFDQEMLGHLQNRGWHTKAAPEVAVEAIKAWKGAEKLVGAPADKIIRLPNDANDEAGMKAVWQRLGVPKAATDYDFSPVTFADKTALDPAFVARMQAKAFALNVPKQAALEIVQDFVKFLDESDSIEAAEKTATLKTQKQALLENWGPNEPANKFIAQRAAAALGVTPETVAALENVIGYDKVMDMFLAIGQKIGEDKFITSTMPGVKPGSPMTVEQAKAKKEDLKSDKVWVDAYLKGDKAKAREMQALDIIISGVAPNA